MLFSPFRRKWMVLGKCVLTWCKAVTQHPAAPATPGILPAAPPTTLMFPASTSTTALGPEAPQTRVTRPAAPPAPGMFPAAPRAPGMFPAATPSLAQALQLAAGTIQKSAPEIQWWQGALHFMLPFFSSWKHSELSTELVWRSRKDRIAGFLLSPRNYQTTTWQLSFFYVILHRQGPFLYLGNSGITQHILVYSATARTVARGSSLSLWWSWRWRP